MNIKVLALIIQKILPGLRSNSDVEVTELQKYWYTQKYSCEVSKLSFSLFKSYFRGYSFQKVGQTPRSKGKGQNCCFPQKDVGLKNTHVKYESSSTQCSKVIIKVNVVKK